jgi:hypothetical protein
LNVEESPPDVAVAVENAGFRVSVDLFGKPTLWCKECSRDSGFHHVSCSKSKPLSDAFTHAVKEAVDLPRPCDHGVDVAHGMCEACEKTKRRNAIIDRWWPFALVVLLILVGVIQYALK